MNLVEAQGVLIYFASTDGLAFVYYCSCLKLWPAYFMDLYGLQLVNKSKNSKNILDDRNKWTTPLPHALKLDFRAEEK